MTNGNDPVTAHLTYDETTGAANGFLYGLSKREYFSAMAMAAMISSGNGFDANDDSIRNISECSVRQADALIKQLNSND